MPALARTDLERLLQNRKLGSTLPAAGPVAGSEARVASSDVPALDVALGGGWPRGQVSEIVAPLSAGATWAACVSLAAATRRGELAALIDPLDTFDPQSAATAGFAWSHLLWVRGAALGPPPHAVAMGRRAGQTVWTMAIERAVKALALVLQAQGFGLVVLDFQGIPPGLVKSLPFTTWRRVQRMVEGRETACVLVHGASLGRSAGGVTVMLDPRDGRPSPVSGREAGPARWAGGSDRSRRLAGLSARGRVVRVRVLRVASDGFAWEGE